MGTPDAVKRLVDRSDSDRKGFLSNDYKEEHFSKAETLHEQEFLQRRMAATDQAIDALVFDLSGLTEEEVCNAEGERR